MAKKKFKDKPRLIFGSESENDAVEKKTFLSSEFSDILISNTLNLYFPQFNVDQSVALSLTTTAHRSIMTE